MELVQKTAKEHFEEASTELSKHLHATGRLRFVIELDEEALEKKRLEYRNLRVDFDKLNKAHQKAFEAWQEEERAKKEELPGTLN